MMFKQVIAVRTDLKMSPGKMAAKVVVKIGGENEIIELLKHAKEGNLPFYLVNDAGLTELEPGTITTLGIGPGPEEIIDRITGQLKLL
jgi:PTH2 family peptidyl-tRNA hydrolase